MGLWPGTKEIGVEYDDSEENWQAYSATPFGSSVMGRFDTKSEAVDHAEEQYERYPHEYHKLVIRNRDGSVGREKNR